MSLVLFNRPVHPQSWSRPAGSDDYRITTRFDGVDLVNGGLHAAVDVGNARIDYPVLAPARCRARGARNYSRNGTDALGLEFDLGNDVRVEVWHLNATLPVSDVNGVPGTNSYGPWREVARGEVVGRTGNSGALVGGKAMPAHSHIVLMVNRKRVDPEPYLLGTKRLPAGELIPEEATLATDFRGATYQDPKIVRLRKGAAVYDDEGAQKLQGRLDEDTDFFFPGLTVGQMHLVRREDRQGGAVWIYQDAIIPESEIPFRRYVLDSGSRIGAAAPHLETAMTALAAAQAALTKD